MSQEHKLGYHEFLDSWTYKHVVLGIKISEDKQRIQYSVWKFHHYKDPVKYITLTYHVLAALLFGDNENHPITPPTQGRAEGGVSVLLAQDLNWLKLASAVVPCQICGMSFGRQLALSGPSKCGSPELCMCAALAPRPRPWASGSTHDIEGQCTVRETYYTVRLF